MSYAQTKNGLELSINLRFYEIGKINRSVQNRLRLIHVQNGINIYSDDLQGILFAIDTVAAEYKLGRYNWLTNAPPLTVKYWA